MKADSLMLLAIVFGFGVLLYVELHKTRLLIEHAGEAPPAQPQVAIHPDYLCQVHNLIVCPHCGRCPLCEAVTQPTENKEA